MRRDVKGMQQCTLQVIARADVKIGVCTRVCEVEKMKSSMSM
jgi:hypothetical protein